jgi:GST-like protein
MLEELSLPYEPRYIDVFKGEQFTPQFLALNPAGKVPVLVDPRLGQPLAESGAILFWLAEQAGALLPATGPARYEVMQWLMVQMASIGPMLGQFTHFSLLPPGSEPYARGRYEALARRLYGLINERLDGRAWIAGGAYSIADIAIFPWAEYIDRHGFDTTPFPAMMRWREAIASRPAVQRARERLLEAFSPGSTHSLTSATSADLDRFFGRDDSVPPQDYSAVTRMR